MSDRVYIGGICDESEGNCICESDYLDGDICQSSCDGVDGPYCNFDTIINVDDMEASHFFTTNDGHCIFYLCSQHGTCDTDGNDCQCDEGYGRSGCSYEYPVFEYNEQLVVLFAGIFLIIILVLIVSLLWLRANVKYKVRQLRH